MFCSLAWYVCCLWNEQTVTGKLRVRSGEVDLLSMCYGVLKCRLKNCWLGVMVTGFGVTFVFVRHLRLVSQRTTKVLLY